MTTFLKVTHGGQARDAKPVAQPKQKFIGVDVKQQLGDQITRRFIADNDKAILRSMAKKGKQK